MFIVEVSFNCQHSLDLAGESLTEAPEGQAGLWAPQDDILIRLIDMGKLSPLWALPFPRWDLGLCKSTEVLSRSKFTYVPLSLFLTGCDQLLPVLP